MDKDLLAGLDGLEQSDQNAVRLMPLHPLHGIGTATTRMVDVRCQGVDVCKVPIRAAVRVLERKVLEVDALQ